MKEFFEKNKKTINFLINFSIAVIIYSIIFRTIIFIELLGFRPGGLVSVITIGLIYILISKARNNAFGREILYNILVGVILFPFLAVTFGNLIPNNVVAILFLAILAYISAYILRSFTKKIIKKFGGEHCGKK